MDSRAFLIDFVTAHPGTHMGRLFGEPAAFAGRRPFARLSPRGLQYRAAVRPVGRRQPGHTWVPARPTTGPGYLQLARRLERAIHEAVQGSGA